MASNLVAPEIPQTQNPILPALSAFVAMSQISNKRRQLEDQLTRMQFQDQQKQREMDIQSANYQSLDASRQIEASAAAARASTVVDKANQASDHAEEIVGLQNAINNIDAEPGTKDYMTQLNLVRPQYAKLLATPDGQRIWNQTFQTHKYTAGQMMQSQKAVASDYINQVKSEKLNPYWFENPDQWAYIDQNGKMTSDPTKAVSRALPFDTDEKGTTIFPVSPSVAKTKDIKIWKTLPVNRFDQLVKQHDAYKGIVSGIITGQQEPDIQNASGPPVKIRVKAPDGTIGLIPNDQLNDAIREGYQPLQ